MSTTLVASHNPGRGDSYDLAPNMPRAFRLRRPPALEPPFDDESDINDVFASWAPPGATRSSMSDLREAGRARLPEVISSDRSGSSTHAASRYVQVCLEVLNGFRPPSHLRTLAGSIEFADVLRRLRLRRNGGWRGGSGVPGANVGDAVFNRPGMRGQHGDADQPAGAPTQSGSRATHSAPVRPDRSLRASAPAAKPVTSADRPAIQAACPPAAFQLLRLRVSEPAPGKAEVVAVIAYGDVSIAIAMRLEIRKSSWVCTVFQIV